MKKTFESLVDEFSKLPRWEDRYIRLIEIGRSMEPMEKSFRTEANRIDGCTSNVWLRKWMKNGNLFLEGDSDAVIVRGLIAVLKILFSGMSMEEVRKVNVFSEMARLGFGEHLSKSRSNALHSLVKRIQEN